MYLFFKIKGELLSSQCNVFIKISQDKIYEIVIKKANPDIIKNIKISFY